MNVNKHDILDVGIGFLILIIIDKIFGKIFLLKISSFFNGAIPQITLLILWVVVAMVIAIIYFMLRRRIIPFLNYFIRRRKELFIAIIGIVICVAIGITQIVIQGRNIDSTVNELFYVRKEFYYLTMFLIIIVMPILEETIFRGYILEILLKNISTIAAVTIVILFSLILNLHYYPGIVNIIFLVAYHTLFSAVYVLSGRIVCCPIIVHAAGNLFYILSSQ